MTVSQIIVEHLGEEWWLKEWDTLTLRVLLDRLMEEKNCGLRSAVWYVVYKAEIELSSFGTLPKYHNAQEHRMNVRMKAFDGGLVAASDLVGEYEVRYGYGYGQWRKIMLNLIAALNEMSVPASNVPL